LTTHLVLIPSYNTGAKLIETVRAARSFWPFVWVVIDGSTDQSAAPVQDLAALDPGVKVLVLPRNRGKGAAILEGLRAAQTAGFTHVLTMDADGQHPAPSIPAFMATSSAQPAAMILGLPVFDASAPALRVKGRKVSNWWANLETLWTGIGDSLCGFRVYPIADAAFRFRSGGRRQALLARRSTDQRASAHSLLPRGRRRGVAFPLWARQLPSDLDAHQASIRVSDPPADPGVSPNQIIPPLIEINCPEI
jgi:glycosyltransferase involved in cell wall biosynthesis